MSVMGVMCYSGAHYVYQVLLWACLITHFLKQNELTFNFYHHHAFTWPLTLKILKTDANSSCKHAVMIITDAVTALICDYHFRLEASFQATRHIAHRSTPGLLFHYYLSSVKQLQHTIWNPRVAHPQMSGSDLNTMCQITNFVIRHGLWLTFFMAYCSRYRMEYMHSQAYDLLASSPSWCISGCYHFACISTRGPFY